MANIFAQDFPNTKDAYYLIHFTVMFINLFC
jgi:hypothetical protein